MKAYLPLIVAFALYAEEAPRWVYQETVEGNSTLTEWFYKESTDGIVYEGISPKTKMTIVCDPDTTVKKVIYLSNKGSTPQESECLRQNGHLKIQNSVGSEKVEKVYRIGEEPWIQEFNFGLRSFAESNDREYKFSIINPKDLTINKMVAKKEKLETVMISGKAYKTQKVKITLQGAKSLFWKAQAWFDLNTHDLVMYQGNRGPNTPLSTITLVDLPQEKK